MIAVTAASGRLGRATLRALATLYPDQPRIAVLRSPGKLAGLPGIEARPGDYGSIESMTAALQGVRTMVLVSAPAIGGLDLSPLWASIGIQVLLILLR